MATVGGMAVASSHQAAAVATMATVVRGWAEALEAVQFDLGLGRELGGDGGGLGGGDGGGGLCCL